MFRSVRIIGKSIERDLVEDETVIGVGGEAFSGLLARNSSDFA